LILEAESVVYGIKFNPMDNNWQQHYEPVDVPEIGKSYHLKWARKSGYVWRLLKILSNGKVLMITPRTNKELITNASDLLHTQKTTFKIRKNKQQ